MVEGNQYTVVNQIRTKPGVYTCKRDNDKIESSFSLSRGSKFKLMMDPATGEFRIDILHTVLPALTVLRILRAQPSDAAPMDRKLCPYKSIFRRCGNILS